MIFHRTWLLRFERALLAVDPGIQALPYWDIAFDSYPHGKYRPDPEKYIFTSEYFGAYWTDPAENYTVTYVPHTTRLRVGAYCL